MSVTAERTEAARRALREYGGWYHTIELAPGVVTPGRVDLRAVAGKVLPDRLGGRALDVGTFDGFWAFALEARGAEVVATDVPRLEAAEWPPLHRARLEAAAPAFGVELGRGFRLAAEALGSAVERVVCDVYDLDAAAIGGPVDLALCGALLLHLRDPVRALERMREALVPGGELLLVEPVSWRATLRAPRRPLAEFRAVASDFTWWLPNLSALKAWAWAAGFVDVRASGPHRPRGPLKPGLHVALRARRPAAAA